MAMQTPAPCEYSRATSVDDAIAQLESARRQRAHPGGRAQPHPDDEAAPRQPGPSSSTSTRSSRSSTTSARRATRSAIGAMTRHVNMLESDLLDRTVPAHLPRGRGRPRRPGRPQPRHDGRLAVPVRPGRGPVRRRRGAQGPGGPARSRWRRARRRDGGVPRRPVHDRSPADRDADRGPLPKRQPGFGGAHEKVERRAGDFAIVAASAALCDPGRQDHVAPASPAARSVRRRCTSSAPRRRSSARRRPRSCSPRRARWPQRTARPTATAADRPTTSATLPACSRTRALSRAAATALRDRRRSDRCWFTCRSTARRTRTTSSRACCSSTTSASTRSCTAPTGAATHPTAASASSSWTTDQTAAVSRQVLHDARRDGRGLRDHDGRGHGEAGRHARPDPAGLSRDARPAVRLLHPGHDVHGPLAHREAPQPDPDDRPRDPRRHLRQPVPLHGLRQHHQGDSVGGRLHRGAPRVGQDSEE